MECVGITPCIPRPMPLAEITRALVAVPVAMYYPHGPKVVARGRCYMPEAKVLLLPAFCSCAADDDTRG
jgi:hypothetical protein